MTSSFTVELDTTTQVGVQINGGSSFAKDATVAFELTLDPDAELVKVWGALDPLDPANAGFGATEEDAEWLPAASTFSVKVTANGGPKALSARVRDDVGNEAMASGSITLLREGEVEPPLPVPSSLPGGGPLRPRRRTTERRRLASRSSAGRVRDHASSVRSRSRRPAIALSSVASSTTLLTRRTQGRSRVTENARTSLRARVSTQHPVHSPGFSRAMTGRRDGADFIASLEELGIL